MAARRPESPTRKRNYKTSSSKFTDQQPKTDGPRRFVLFDLSRFDLFFCGTYVLNVLSKILANI